MKAEKLDKLFDDGEDISPYLDMSSIRQPNSQEIKGVNIDFPTWMLESLDREAKHAGVTRQSLIKAWVAERLEQQDS